MGYETIFLITAALALPWDRKQWDAASDPTSQGVPLRSHETQHEALLVDPPQKKMDPM